MVRFDLTDSFSTQRIIIQEILNIEQTASPNARNPVYRQFTLFEGKNTTQRAENTYSSNLN
jgi:hypothetical protein